VISAGFFQRGFFSSVFLFSRVFSAGFSESLFSRVFSGRLFSMVFSAGFFQQGVFSAGDFQQGFSERKEKTTT